MAIPTQTTVYGRIPTLQRGTRVIVDTAKTIGFKYPIEANSKKYYQKSSGYDLVKSSLKSLIRTVRGERFMLPDYGCNLKRFLMEPIDQTLFSQIKDDIVVSVSRYLKSVQINKLQILETKSNVINVKLFCSLRKAAEVTFNVDIEF